MATFNRTIIVIGAGAHVPYGMPTGIQLSDEIKALHSIQTDHKIAIIQDSLDFRKKPSAHLANELAKVLRALGIVEDPKERSPANAYDLKIGNAIDYSISCFAKSGMYTIDSYLSCKASQKEDHPYNVIGILKVAMLFVLAKKQDNSQLGYGKFDWIEYIINEFLSKDRLIDKFLKNPPIFYTFNYDTVLESLIEGHLIQYHGMPKEQAHLAIDRLGIQHIYGGFDFKKTGNIASRIEHALPSIRLVGSDRDSSAFEPITLSFSNQISKTKEVIFLGFGFDEKNCDILLSSYTKSKIGQNNGDPSVCSTGVGVDDRWRDRVTEIFDNKIAICTDIDCLGVLKRNKSLFST